MFSYNQKGGSADGVNMKSNFVLGHEIMHGWTFEFTNMSRSDNYGNRLQREKAAVTFENYLRASAGETNMREVYTLKGNAERIFAGESTSVARFKDYKLPTANYMRAIKMDYPKLPRDADNTINRQGRRPIFVDSRKEKL